MSAQPETRAAGTAPAAARVGSAGPELDFEVLGARPVRHAAAPMLALDLRVSEPSGRQVYMIALTIQLMIEPARRELRRRHARAAGRAVRRARALGGDDAQPRVGAARRAWCPRSPGSTTVAVPIACNYDLEVAAAKYLYSLPDGEAPLALHFNGIVYYPDEDGGLQMVLVPWTTLDRLPHARVGLARDDRALLPQHRLGRRCARRRCSALERERVDRGLPTYDALRARALLERAAR